MKKIFSLLTLIAGSCSLMAQSGNYGILTYNAGSVFRANEYGQPIQLIHHFDTLNGAEPMGGLVPSGTRLYGRTKIGGINNTGVLYYVDTETPEFSSIQHLPSSFNDNFLSAYTIGGNDDTYSTGNLSNVRGRLYRTNFIQNEIDILAEFNGFNTYYKPLIYGNHLFIPGSKTTAGFDDVVFKFDLTSSEVEDTLTLDPLIFGSGTFQLVQYNDSTAYGINGAGGIHGDGAITKLNLNDFTIDTLFSFDFSTSILALATIRNVDLYFFNYDNGSSIYTCYQFNGGQLDSLFSITGSNSLDERPGNIRFSGDNLVFSAGSTTYNFDVNTDQLVAVGVISMNIYGTGSFLNEPLSFVSTPLETIENNEISFSISPNPVSDQLIIQSTEDEDLPVYIYAPDGRLVLQSKTTGLQTKLSVDGLKSGMYLVRIGFDGQTKSQRIVKN